MQLTTKLHRRWLAATQRRQRVICAANRAAGSTLSALGAKSFTDPVCGYNGPFVSFKGRRHAMCPSCGSLERHRLQRLVLDAVPERTEFKKMRILHVAPEVFFIPLLRDWFKDYKSADLTGDNVDYQADLCNLQFEDGSFDVVYASHVLEHIQDDRKALSEIHRVLSPNGMAFLPVPIFVGIPTVEYPHPVKTETDHVRQPGTLDYFERHSEFFPRIQQYTSDAFGSQHQLYSLEERGHWPTKDMPYRLPVAGSKHLDIVPVCYKSALAGSISGV
jgi:predicted SAM-dependent methyltransferase